MQEHLNLIDALQSRDPASVATQVAFHIHSAHQRVFGRDRRVLGEPARQRSTAH